MVQIIQQNKLKAIIEMGIQDFPVSICKVLLSSRLAELKNQIANENTPNKTQESR